MVREKLVLTNNWAWLRLASSLGSKSIQSDPHSKKKKKTISNRYFNDILV